jgi:iron complex transport system ATP-binding protein
VAQEAPAEFDFTVEEVVAMGRTPHKRPWDRDTAKDRRICVAALGRVGLAEAATRSLATLSGGRSSEC